MLIAYKYRIYPNKQQKQKIQSTLERCRLLYNRLLEERILAYKQEGMTHTYFDQASTLNERKQHIPALKEVDSKVLQDVARRIDGAFHAFFRRINRGEKPEFPRFKPQQQHGSFTYKQGFSIVGNGVRLSKIGDVQIELHRQLQEQIKTCTVTVKNGEYYACFSCIVDPQVSRYPRIRLASIL
ncbi:MAG: hypothetical protein JWM44_1986 [Bacilli bacterium]|nr:hypothetical protein [Bacilli bacterium]